jgi:hypothetical protein
MRKMERNRRDEKRQLKMARKIALSPGGRRAGQRVSLAPKT